jgi:hypothetical protein
LPRAYILFTRLTACQEGFMKRPIVPLPRAANWYLILACIFLAAVLVVLLHKPAAQTLPEPTATEASGTAPTAK